jgi:hypothetical protein
MSIFLDNVRDYLEENRITDKQALYLIFTKAEISYYIDDDNIMLELVEAGFIKNNRISPSLLTEVRETSKLSGTIRANYVNDISKDVTAKLARLFCVRNTTTGLVKLPGDEGEADPVAVTAEKYLQKEGLIAYHYIIFLYLFPVKSTFNRKWEKHFTSTEYKGAMLRQRSKITGSLFLKAVKNKDMGAFLYGTYLYIASTIQGNKAYITTIPKYLKEYDEWYYIALELIKNAKTVDELFKRNDLKKEGRINVAL